MQLSSTVNHGIVQNLDRLCGSTTNTYSFKSKMADLNDALDWYCQVAFKADGQWNFDDINETSPPIDSQNIVSGTNRYKMSAFSEKILNLLKLEVLDSAGNGHGLIPETLDSFGNVVGNESGRMGNVSADSFDKTYVNAPSGMPTHYIKYGDFIYLRPKPDYSIASGLKAYFNRAANKFEFVPVTVTAATNIFSATSHGLVAGDTIIFETDGTIPTGLTADTQYYVISDSLTSNAFKVSTTLGGSEVDVTNAQTASNHAFLKTSGEPGIASIHHVALVRKAALQYLIYNSSPKIGILPQLVAQDEKMIAEYFGRRDKDMVKRLISVLQDNR